MSVIDVFVKNICLNISLMLFDLPFCSFFSKFVCIEYLLKKKSHTKRRCLIDIKWFRLEKYYTVYDAGFIEKSLPYQYLYILALCIFGKKKMISHLILC